MKSEESRYHMPIESRYHIAVESRHHIPVESRYHMVVESCYHMAQTSIEKSLHSELVAHFEKMLHFLHVGSRYNLK